MERPSRRIDMIGKRFGRLVVTALSEQRGHRNQLMYVCKCDCGNTVIVLGESLRRHRTASCGCLQKERAKEVNKTHGGSNERLYFVWQGMKNRCTNPNFLEYKNYGGRGIKVCEEWLDYESFKKFMLEKGYDPSAPFGEYTIERIDVNGNYEPNNCTIASQKEQVHNMTSNHNLTYKGETKCLSEWAREIGINATTLLNRLQRGMSVEEAIETPPKRTVMYEVDGESHSCKEWVKIIGICEDTVRKRLKEGYNMKEIVHKYKKFR